MIASPAAPPLAELIRSIPDYPRSGIMFRDITTLLRHAEGLRAAVDGLVLLPTIEGGRIAALEAIADPDRLRQLAITTFD
jgi:adenine/guanine phosphoribosyltransferase-like PRPP-binding protein